MVVYIRLRSWGVGLRMGGERRLVGLKRSLSGAALRSGGVWGQGREIAFHDQDRLRGAYVGLVGGYAVVYDLGSWVLGESLAACYSCWMNVEGRLGVGSARLRLLRVVVGSVDRLTDEENGCLMYWCWV